MPNTPFIEIRPTDIRENVFELIDKQWFLLTAGSIGHFNTMTASWGTLGILWKKPIVICFVRPNRYTYQFMESSDRFTLSFFKDEHRSKLNFCGKFSGREVDKIASTGLIPVETSNGAVYFEQAYLVMECKKMYFSDIDPANFLNASIINNYPLNDFHRFYIGEIEKCLQKSL